MPKMLRSNKGTMKQSFSCNMRRKQAQPVAEGEEARVKRKEEEEVVHEVAQMTDVRQTERERERERERKRERVCVCVYVCA